MKRASNSRLCLTLLINIILGLGLQSVQAQEESGGRELRTAARAGKIGQVRKLLDEHPKLIDSVDYNSITALGAVAGQSRENSHLEIAEMLIARGANLNIADS